MPTFCIKKENITVAGKETKDVNFSDWNHFTMADPRGTLSTPTPQGPISFIFLQFLTELSPNNRFSLQISGVGTPSPFLGNPGSVTAIERLLLTLPSQYIFSIFIQLTAKIMSTNTLPLWDRCRHCYPTCFARV